MGFLIDVIPKIQLYTYTCVHILTSSTHVATCTCMYLYCCLYYFNCSYSICSSVFLISLYGVPLSQRASYLAQYKNSKYILTNS